MTPKERKEAIEKLALEVDALAAVNSNMAEIYPAQGPVYVMLSQVAEKVAALAALLADGIEVKGKGGR